MLEAGNEAAFFAQLAIARVVVWPLAPGIGFIGRCEQQRWGITLHIQRRALRPGQLHEALQTRFSQVPRFSQCFMGLQTQGDLVVWHAVGEVGATRGSAYDERARS
jgi:hypothetical protein